MSGPAAAADTVLVIEDDLGLADLIQEEFSQRGWGFAHCRTGREAVAWLAVHQASLALLDFSLPDMSGVELLDLVAMPPFIVTTGAGDERIAVQMMKRGALDYLVKDANFLETLPGLVERALHQVGTERRLAEAEASLRLAEEHLKHAQKRESLGLMAGGIAHDFNNLFQSLQGNLEIARVHARDSEARPFLDRALGILAKASVLTHRMLDFSGKGFRNSSVLDLNALVREGLGPMAALPGSGIHFQEREPLPAIEGDAGQLTQVLIGLLVNAREAQGPDGSIRVATGLTPPDPAAAGGVWIHPAPAGETTVWLEIADNGSGMSPEVLDRAFDPFFTTHRPGRGLGLSAALGILRGHQAGLWVATAPGQGTTFRVCFAPAVEVAVAGHSGGLQVVGDQRRTVLLVDDDEDLQETLAEYLREGLGYHVLQARDGVEAVETFRLEHEDIGVILMDATMPRMTGPDAFRAIREEFPGAQAILCSGFSEEAGSQVALEGGFVEFLKKPFSLKTLEDSLRRALGTA